MCTEGVEVKLSLIPDAGNGLFAIKKFHKGDIICEYSGKVISFIQAFKAIDKSYIMGGFGLNVHIDAKDCFESMGRYINDPRNPALENSKFIKVKAERKALVVAIKDINV